MIVKKFISKNLLLLLALLLSMVIGRTLLTSQHFHTHDDIQVFRLADYEMCWEDGQIPCRWSKNLGKGYGYPLFVFYPPTIYFVPLLFNQLGLTNIASYNFFMFLTLPVAAYGMYRLTYALTRKKELAFLGSVLYSFYPYHAQNIFIRGVYAENLAWSLLPFVFWQFYELITENRKSHKPAILLALIFLTHNISSMLFYPLIIFWCILLLAKNRKKTKKYRETLKLTIKNLLLPIPLAAFFLVPALVERTIVQSDSMIMNYYSYLVHFASMNQILISDFWGYGGSGPDLLDGMSFMIGKPYWITFALLAGYYIYKNRKSRDRLFHPLVIMSLVFAPLFTFMMHIRSTPIWQLFTPLQYIQFPWRLLGVAGFFIILFITFAANQLPEKLRKYFVAIMAILVITLYFPFFKPEKYDKYQDEDFISGQFSNEQKESHLYDYMPTTVHQIPGEIASSAIYESENPIESTTNIVWRSNFTELTITQNSDNIITFSSIEYPDWQGYIDGEPVEHQVDSITGLVKLAVPSGTHQIRIERKEPAYRIFGNIISILTFTYLLLITIKNRNSS